MKSKSSFWTFWTLWTELLVGTDQPLGAERAKYFVSRGLRLSQKECGCFTRASARIIATCSLRDLPFN
jgi:hypothetical protein